MRVRRGLSSLVASLSLLSGMMASRRDWQLGMRPGSLIEAAPEEWADQ